MATTRPGGILGALRGYRMANLAPATVLPSGARRTLMSLPPVAVRFLALFALTLIPFWGVFRGIALSVAGGSQLTYLAVVPVLTAMIAAGHSAPPAGVGDAESDWILAGIFGGLGLFLRHLMSNRFPTLSGLWQLPLVGAVLWMGCLTAVLFGVRRVIQMWALWIFAIATVTPLPYLLATASLGGGVDAHAVALATIAGIAVALAAGSAPPQWRIAVSVATALSCAAVMMLAGAVESPYSRLVLVLLSGGVIPVAAFAILHRRRVSAASLAPESIRTAATLLPRSPLAGVALAAGAVIVLLLNQPFSRIQPLPPQADVTWVARLGLSVHTEFRFVQRYLGPRATFVRYQLPLVADEPAAALDVITTDNLASLRSYADAIWYPATVPPNYRPQDLGSTAVSDGRSAATDSSLATDWRADDWYVVTWLWQSEATYQQIFVVLNQTWSSQVPPPAPQALSVRATVIGPALWLMRQQADPGTKIDPPVSARAQQIVRAVLDAGMPRRD